MKALVLLLVLLPGAASADVYSVRKPMDPAVNHNWICEGADGTFISGHQRQDQAQAACTALVLAAPGSAFVVTPGAGYEITADPLSCPTPPPCPTCPPPPVCPPGPLLEGNRGVWSWVAPTKLENGNILTDLDHFLMYRQAAGGQPEIFAQVNGKATSLVWGMDTAYANACFWFVAVRKPATSPAVPSDKSNIICMDAQGQPLPTT